jgi:hypothetical protein
VTSPCAVFREPANSAHLGHSLQLSVHISAAEPGPIILS